MNGTYLNALVDSLFSHLTVGCPLSTGNSDEVVVAYGDDVVTSDRLGVLGVGVGDEGTNARPHGEDIATANCWQKGKRGVR